MLEQPTVIIMYFRICNAVRLALASLYQHHSSTAGSSRMWTRQAAVHSGARMFLKAEAQAIVLV